MTQFILSAAASQLHDRLSLEPGDSGTHESVPRVLSALVGHEPFVQNQLGLSVNQMRRRWPQAMDWYEDLLAYILRPHRHGPNRDHMAMFFDYWKNLSLGELIAKLTQHQIDVSSDVEQYRLSDTVMWLWPEAPAVKRALEVEMECIYEFWNDIIERTAELYGLRFRLGIQARDITWAGNALLTWEAHQRTIDPDFRRYKSIDGKITTSMSARMLMIILASVYVDEHDCSLSPDELYHRMPRQ